MKFGPNILSVSSFTTHTLPTYSFLSLYIYYRGCDLKFYLHISPKLIGKENSYYPARPYIISLLASILHALSTFL